MTKRIFTHLAQDIGAVFTVLASLIVPCYAHAESYTITIAPQSSPLELAKAWKPLVDHLNKSAGGQFELKLSKNRDDFEKSVFGGEPDLVFFNGFYLTLAEEKQGYTALVRSNAKKPKGIIVAAKDSPINSIDDLKGKTIAFPSPNALGASLFIRALLDQKSVSPVTPVYLGTHDNVYLSVISGKAAAGGGIYGTFNTQNAKIKDKLKVIFETPSFSPHPLAVHPRVPEKIRNQIVEAILELNKSEEGKAILANVKLQDPVRADTKADYSVITELKLKKYSTYE
jgi:phosphonate transport system substrate-binding protein